MCLEVYNIDDIKTPPSPFIEEQDAEPFLQAVFIGAITPTNLSVINYAKTVNYLMNATNEGLGGIAGEFGTGINAATIKIEENVWRFAAAKQYQQVRTLSSLIFKGVDFETFKKPALNVWQDYNVNWLQSEWQTGFTQAQNARNWLDWESNDNIKTLKYHTQKDSRVRQSHQQLDGVQLSKDDPFWDTYAPANGWRCRCFLTGETSTRVTKPSRLKKRNIPEFGTEDFPMEFKQNAGKTFHLFSNRHPYYNVPRKDLDLKRRNFDLPLPPKP